MRSSVGDSVIRRSPTWTRRPGRTRPRSSSSRHEIDAAGTAYPSGPAANTSLDSTRPSTPLTSRTEVTMRRSSPPEAKSLTPLDEDDEVDRAGDQHHRRVGRQPLGGLDGVGADAVEHLERGVGVDRRQRAVVALAHRVEHGHDLVAEHLTDDDPAGVHAQRAAHQLGHRGSRPGPRSSGSRSSNATTLGCRSANSPSPSSSARSTVISRSCGGDLVGQRPQQRGLAGVGGARRS